MSRYELVSADSHVLEPPDLWTSYLPAKFHAKAPRVVSDGDGGEAWQFAPDVPPAPIGIYASAGRAHDDVRWTGVTFAAANQGNFRGDVRLQEMDADGVDAEVLYGSARMLSHFFSDPDPAFHLAGVQAYNSWLADAFVTVAPDRLIGLAAMPALGVDTCIAELERALKLGLRGAWLLTLPSAGPAIRPEDDRFWDAAQALDVAVHFHVRLMRQVTKPHPKGIRGDTLHGLAGNGAQACLTDLPEIIASGVHDRFPRLTWVAAETGAGWIPYILEQLDDRWWRNRSWLPVRLRHPPSVYFRRNWRATFMIDHVAVENREAIGVENLMWSTDYPHHGCDWPASRRAVTAMFRDVPAPERDRMCAGNAVALYGLDDRASKQEVR
jgi:predicted TIM-barrel fold metal-dependent hydrolase